MMELAVWNEVVFYFLILMPQRDFRERIETSSDTCMHNRVHTTQIVDVSWNAETISHYTVQAVTCSTHMEHKNTTLLSLITATMHHLESNNPQNSSNTLTIAMLLCGPFYMYYIP
jgi:hypothetical protein